MSFIDNHVDPFDLGQQRSFLDDILVGSHTDLEITRSDSTILFLSLEWTTFENDTSNGRCPSFEFKSPIGQCRERYKDEERTGLTFLFNQVGDERDCLDRFSETLLD